MVAVLKNQQTKNGFVERVREVHSSAVGLEGEVVIDEQ